MTSVAVSSPVLCMRNIEPGAVSKLLQRFGLQIEWLDEYASISGSFWGDSEAGIVGSSVYVRPDTPVHSMLHETCHIICMPLGLRISHTGNAESDDLEEAAVCYLQILLADELPDVGRHRLMCDMDAWGYSFRLGDTTRWFQSDSDDAREWLRHYHVLDTAGGPSFKLRSC